VLLLLTHDHVLHAVLQADFLISLDAHFSDKAPGDDGLETFQAGRLMNTGVYYARARIQGERRSQQPGVTYNIHAITTIATTASAPA
jgi:hypothetical protein